jgi:hypothetical protein
VTVLDAGVDDSERVAKLAAVCSSGELAAVT